MKKIFISFSLFFSIYTYSQVGINTEVPKGTLDIAATEYLTSPDGILIPRISKLRAKNIYNPEISTLIYINQLDDNSNSGSTIYVDNVGFYFFDGSHWVKLISGKTDSNIYNTSGNLNENREVNQKSHQLAFTSKATAGTNHFSVDNNTLSVNTVNDRVGIGTTEPESKLHVAGDLQFSGTLKVGENGNPGASNQVLMSKGENMSPEWADFVTSGTTNLLFNNGLTENPNIPNNIQLGGDLSQNTSIDLDNKSLSFISTGTSDDNSTFILQSTKYTDPLLYADLKNNRIGIRTNQPKQLFHAQSDFFVGGAFYVGTGIGDPGTPGQFLKSNGANNPPEWVTLNLDNDITYTFNNGLQSDSDITNNIELGGNLTQDTEINTSGKTFSITGNTSDAFNLKDANNAITLSADLENKKVGIGTQSPTTTLDINGDLRIRNVNPSGNSNNQILTITEAGLVQKMNSTSATYFLGGTAYVKRNTPSGGSLNDEYVINKTLSGYPGTKGGINSIKGNGYKISNPENGLFVIQFDIAYTTIYGVSLNIVDAYDGDSYIPDQNVAGLNLPNTNNTQISYISNTHIIVKTGDTYKRNRSFSFLVVGK